MLLAIDVGNTEVKAGLWNGTSWRTWRTGTAQLGSAASWEHFLSGAKKATAVICASVVPTVDKDLAKACSKALRLKPTMLSAELDLGLANAYRTPKKLGADRLADVLGTLALGCQPGIVVDFGTATKIEAIGNKGEYLGGAILPGLALSAQALSVGTAKLPNVPLAAPERVIGNDTDLCVRSGVVHGHAAAVDGMVARFREEIGADAECVATGGFAPKMLRLCRTPMRHEPNLTLDGLREAARRLG